jgi:RNA polymerase sigma-70 factor (ECF subfamily)
VGALDEHLNSKERLQWEQRVLLRARRGEAQAMGELYDAYASLIFSRVLLPKLGSRAAAEDALSETFRMALERLNQFEPRNISVYFWFARIATNKATDMHRARGVTGRVLCNLEDQMGALLDGPLSPDAAFDARAHYERVRQRMVECLAELNPRYRRAIELRFFEELSREQCAEMLDVKLGTFDVLLLRALKALRKRWEAADEEREAKSDRLG